MPSQRDKPTGIVRPHYFLLRKLHSLTGVVPVGVFLCMHLATNASVLGGAGAFQRNVDRIHSIEPFLVPIEIFGIFLPIAFHSVLGVRIWMTSRSNVRQYPYADNIRYTLQRITGLVTIAFIAYHLWQMHWLGRPFGGNAFRVAAAAATAGAAIQRAWWVAPVYAVGIVAACCHFANGLWTFLISWGITIGPNAQRTARYVCAAIGLAIASMGLAALWAFDRTPVEKRRPVRQDAVSGKTAESPHYYRPNSRSIALIARGRGQQVGEPSQPRVRGGEEPPTLRALRRAPASASPVPFSATGFRSFPAPEGRKCVAQGVSPGSQTRADRKPRRGDRSVARRRALWCRLPACIEGRQRWPRHTGGPHRA